MRQAILAGANASSRSMPAPPSPLKQSTTSASLRRSAPPPEQPSPYKVSRPRLDRPSPAPENPSISLWGPEPVPLPSRFARIKKNLIAGHEDALEASWIRLLAAIRDDVERIEMLGAHLIPSIEYSDLNDPAQTSRFGHDLRRYGVGVVRKVIPRADVEASVQDTIRYVEEQSRRGHRKASTSSPGAKEEEDPNHRNVNTPKYDPACFDLFWSPAQVRTRAHPAIQHTQRFMMSLWDTRRDDPVAIQHPITYADRIRIYGPGAGAPAAKVNPRHWKKGMPLPDQAAPQSTLDWIGALHSSAGIMSQVDNGSLERWEPDGYQRAKTYSAIFDGHWEEYDPWRSAGRLAANMDLYSGYGSCTIFRMFQGIVALSTVEPGMVRLLPSPKLATAYYLLRPFFESLTPAPDWMSPRDPAYSDAWAAYLAPSNWKLKREPDTVIHGAVPGHAQRVTERWHPHLMLRSSMITLPTLQPGDYILWHPDLPYHLSAGEGVHGVETPASNKTWIDDARMLAYVPAAPLTQAGALYLSRQRKAYQRGQPGPDFDSSGAPNQPENADIRPSEEEIERVGGLPALRAMGLAVWEDDSERDRRSLPLGSPENAALASPASSSVSTAEGDVVRLANVILFPDKALIS